jgi:Fe-S cluster biogenesis protein NfuA
MNAAAATTAIIARYTLSRRALPRTLRLCQQTAVKNNSSLVQSAAIAASPDIQYASPNNHQRSTSTFASPIKIKPKHHLLPSQRRSLFIQTATTPNPESLKFIPNGRLVLGHIPNDVDPTANLLENGEEISIDNKSNNTATSNNDNLGFHITRKDHNLIARSPLAKLIFHLDEGIKSIYLGHDFITVTKYAEAHWQHLQTPIFGAIMDFYSTNQPALLEMPEITDTTILDDDDEVVCMIKELLESRIRPAVQEDGGDIKYVGFEEHTGIVTVRLAGSCVGCPSSSVTLKNGVENMLMHYIPEVTAVVSLEDEDDGSEEGKSSEGGDEVVVARSNSSDKKKMKTYEERLAAAGIPFSD